MDTAGRSEAALIVAEIYKRNGAWKIRNVSQGFNGGLAALATHFGVEIAAPELAPTPQPAPGPQPAPKPVSLSKVSLTKNERTVSLKKDDGRFGRIKVNLNWNQKKRGAGSAPARGSTWILVRSLNSRQAPQPRCRPWATHSVPTTTRPSCS